MHPLFMHRAVAVVVTVLVAGTGFAGYTYAHQNQQSQQPPHQPGGACVIFASDLYYNWSGNPAGDVARLQSFLVSRGYQAGQTGVFDQPTLNAVEQFENDQGLTVTGYVDPLLRQRIQTVSCGGNGNNTGGYQNTNGQLSITGVDAAQQLAVGQTGTWSVHVSITNGYQGGGQIHYSVVWGDEPQYAQTTANNQYVSTTVQSSGSFTHVYARAGTFTPVFTVTDDYGHHAQASATTYVSGGNGNNSYCQTQAGWYDRSCSNTNSNTGYNNGNQNGNGTTVDYYARTGNTNSYNGGGSNYPTNGSNSNGYYTRTGTTNTNQYGNGYNGTGSNNQYNNQYGNQGGSDYYTRTGTTNNGNQYGNGYNGGYTNNNNGYNVGYNNNGYTNNNNGYNSSYNSYYTRSY